MIGAILLVLTGAAAEPSDRLVMTGRPWAPFISPMGEPFRARNRSDDTLVLWFPQADRDANGALTPIEMQADAERFFATIDSDHNGEIDPTELMHYELEVAPEIQVTSRKMRAPGESQARDRHRGNRRGPGSNLDSALGLGGALQGGARYSLLNLPEPVAAADTDFDRGVSLAEFRQAAARRFLLLNSARSGSITLAQLDVLRQAVLRRKPKARDDVPDERVGNGLPSAD